MQGAKISGTTLVVSLPALQMPVAKVRRHPGTGRLLPLEEDDRHPQMVSNR